MFKFGDNLGRNISLANRRLSAMMDRRLSKYGLASGQFRFLFVLYGQDGLSQKELAEKLIVDKAAIARTVLKLEESGYITRLNNKDDRRSYFVYLTEKSKSIRADLEKEAADTLNGICNGLSDSERKEAERLIKIIAANANASV